MLIKIGDFWVNPASINWLGKVEGKNEVRVFLPGGHFITVGDVDADTLARHINDES